MPAPTMAISTSRWAAAGGPAEPSASRSGTRGKLSGPGHIDKVPNGKAGDCGWPGSAYAQLLPKSQLLPVPKRWNTWVKDFSNNTCAYVEIGRQIYRRDRCAVRSDRMSHSHER